MGNNKSERKHPSSPCKLKKILVTVMSQLDAMVTRCNVLLPMEIHDKQF